MDAAASFSSFSRRPAITTCAPSSTKRLAVAKPIPLLPPVITATLPVSFCPWLLLICLLLCVLRVFRLNLQSKASASDLRQPAVNGEFAGSHEAAVVRREKGRRRPDLRRIGHALERSHRGVDLLALLA